MFEKLFTPLQIRGLELKNRSYFRRWEQNSPEKQAM